MNTPNPDKPTLTYELITEWLRYDSDTGHLFWIKRPNNKIKVGQRAGTRTTPYERIGINGYSYLSSHIVWTLLNHYVPENLMDHIDRNTLNNRPANIRETSYQCNGRNSKLNKLNNTGIKGVIAKRGKYIVTIRSNGVQKYIGTFKNKLEAARARFEAERELGWDTCELHSPAKQFVYLWEAANNIKKSYKNIIKINS